jgi:hypothetical protein
MQIGNSKPEPFIKSSSVGHPFSETVCLSVGNQIKYHIDNLPGPSTIGRLATCRSLFHVKNHVVSVRQC